MKISGIYKIQSIIKPERVYIGSAVWIAHRWDQHLSDLRKNKRKNSKLQNHFNKYGEADLQFSILLGCDKEDLLKTEQYFIDSYKPWFNICPVAGSQFGRHWKLSKEDNERKSKIQKGKTHIGYAKGKKRSPLSDEHKQNLKEAWKKRSPMTDVTKQKMKDYAILHNKQFPSIKGTFHSKEWKDNISKSIIEHWKIRRLNKAS